MALSSQPRELARLAPGGIIFDFDDTLVHSSAAYAAGLRAVGIAPGSPAYAAARSATKQSLGAASPSSSHRLLYFKRMQQAGALPQAKGPLGLLQLAAQYERAVSEHIAKQWQDLGRSQLLRTLAKVAPICVLTNETARTQLGKWAAVDPHGELLAGFVTSEEVGAPKPARAAFEAAAATLGCPLKSCIVVGDSLAHDIAPALDLCRRAFWSREFASDAESLATPPWAQQAVQLSSLAELPLHLNQACVLQHHSEDMNQEQ